MSYPLAGSRCSPPLSLRRRVRQLATVLLAVLAVSACQWDTATTRELTITHAASTGGSSGDPSEVAVDDDRDDPLPIGIAGPTPGNPIGPGAGLCPASADPFTTAFTELDGASYGCGFLRESARRN